MNPEIKQLANRALDQAVPETWTTLSASQLERFQTVFAQHIVETCARLVSDLVDHRVPASEYPAEIRRHLSTPSDAPFDWKI